jgi:ketol-acid reductoisomerase
MIRIAHSFGFERKNGRGRPILVIRLVSGVRIPNTMQLETLQDLYGTARPYAGMLGNNEGAKLLQTTFGEEAETDLRAVGEYLTAGKSDCLTT